MVLDIEGHSKDKKKQKFISFFLFKDWNSRPNGLDPVGGDGPGREGLKTLGGFFSIMVRDLKFDRKHTFICGDRVAVLSKMSGTIGDAPAGFDELPIFPGIPLDKLRGMPNSDFNYIKTDQKGQVN